MNHSLILFDGVCNLCNRAVDFIIRRDRGRHFKFASLQSDVGKQHAERHGVDLSSVDSVVLIDSGKAYLKSSAALRIAKKLRGGWPLLYGLIIVPKPLRNWTYDWIARNRYQWFGKKETCRLPTRDEQALFL